MPQLKRIVADADADAKSSELLLLHQTTAEQLFSESLHSQRLPELRRQAAAHCAAPGTRMSALLGEDNELARSVAQSSYRRCCGCFNVRLTWLLLEASTWKRCQLRSQRSEAWKPRAWRCVGMVPAISNTSNK